MLDENLGEVLTNGSFKNITTIRIGGKIKYLYLPNSIDSLCRVYKFIVKNKIKYYVVSGGSNILATDNYFDGVVILLKSMPSSYQLYSDNLVVDAFYSSAKLAKELARLEISSLSFLANVPGLIGGAIRQNSGCFNECIKDTIVSCKYIDEDGVIQELNKEDIKLDYRKSIFDEIKGIIIEGTFKVIEEKNVVNKIEEQTQIKRQNQPTTTYNMGSVFKNGSYYQAWKVIDDLGFRGYEINDACVSPKHPNFIVNKDSATSDDVLKLIKSIQEKAILNYNINLECEINVVM